MVPGNKGARKRLYLKRCFFLYFCNGDWDTQKPMKITKSCSDWAWPWSLGSIASPNTPQGWEKVALMFTKFGAIVALNKFQYFTCVCPTVNRPLLTKCPPSSLLNMFRLCCVNLPSGLSSYL